MKTIIEPFRIKSVEPIYFTTKEERKTILEKAKVSPIKKVADLTDEEIAEIRAVITSEYRVEGALRSEVQQNIKRLMDIGSYRGVRHRKSLPARGQRTRRACSRIGPARFPGPAAGVPPAAAR